MDLLNSYIKRNDNIAWRVIEGEALVVDPKDSMIYPLNPVGARIWQLLDGEKNISDIISVINEEFEADKLIIQADTLDFLKDLLDKGMVKQCV